MNYNIVLNDEHEYYVNGVRVPGVTEVLGVDDRWFDEVSTVRGQHVHMACQFLDEGKLNWKTVAPDYEPYVNAYVDFRKNHPWEVVLSEHTAYCPTYRYAGTLDRLFKRGPSMRLVDIKTSEQPQPWWKYQLAGYYGLIATEYPHALRYTLQLSRKGTYTLNPPYFDMSDLTDFQQLVASWHIREEWSGNKQHR